MSEIKDARKHICLPKDCAVFKVTFEASYCFKTTDAKRAEKLAVEQFADDLRHGAQAEMLGDPRTKEMTMEEAVSLKPDEIWDDPELEDESTNTRRQK